MRRRLPGRACVFLPSPSAAKVSARSRHAGGGESTSGVSRLICWQLARFSPGCRGWELGHGSGLHLDHVAFMPESACWLCVVGPVGRFRGKSGLVSACHGLLSAGQ